MSDQLISSVVTVLMAIIGVAIIAVLVSRQSATSEVLGAGAGAFSSVLGAALTPVTSARSFDIGRGVGGINFTF